jgi:hypothetical protein
VQVVTCAFGFLDVECQDLRLKRNSDRTPRRNRFVPRVAILAVALLFSRALCELLISDLPRFTSDSRVIWQNTRRALNRALNQGACSPVGSNSPSPRQSYSSKSLPARLYRPDQLPSGKPPTMQDHRVMWENPRALAPSPSSRYDRAPAAKTVATIRRWICQPGTQAAIAAQRQRFVPMLFRQRFSLSRNDLIHTSRPAEVSTIFFARLPTDSDLSTATRRSPRLPSAIAVASFQTPDRLGISRTRTPSSLIIRRTLALIAIDNPKSSSNSKANASSTFERSTGSVYSETEVGSASTGPTPPGFRTFAEHLISWDRKITGRVAFEPVHQRLQ